MIATHETVARLQGAPPHPTVGRIDAHRNWSLRDEKEMEVTTVEYCRRKCTMLVASVLYKVEFLHFKFCTKFLCTTCSVFLRICTGIH